MCNKSSLMTNPSTSDPCRIIRIWFDGGCKPTNPGNKYGSFKVDLGICEVFKAQTVSLGYGTNNEAEFNILIRALQWVQEELMKSGLPMNYYELQLFTDSMVVKNRISKRNVRGKSESAGRMANLTSQCISVMDGFKAASIEWNPRGVNVHLFGH